MKQTAFLQLALHAKLQRQLDRLDTRVQHDVERIEEQEIRSYADDHEFARLETLKKELLGIRFIEKK